MRVIVRRCCVWIFLWRPVEIWKTLIIGPVSGENRTRVSDRETLCGMMSHLSLLRCPCPFLNFLWDFIRVKHPQKFVTGCEKHLNTSNSAMVSLQSDQSVIEESARQLNLWRKTEGCSTLNKNILTLRSPSSTQYRERTSCSSTQRNWLPSNFTKANHPNSVALEWSISKSFRSPKYSPAHRTAACPTVL